MPSPPDAAIDERFEELAQQLRAARPRASEELRARVRTLPVPAERRSLVRVLVPALAVAVVAGGAIVGLASRGSPSGDSARQAAETRPTSALRQAGRAGGAPAQSQQSLDAVQAPESSRAVPRRALPPARRRAQDYRAELHVRVAGAGELSRATARAMRETRRLGGFIVTARYDTRTDGVGDSSLVVRVPVRQVQQAIQRFSALGTLIGQRISVADLQSGLNRQSDAIAALRGTISVLETTIEDPELSAEARARLRVRLVNARRDLAARVESRNATRRRAATARLALTLTTRERVELVQRDEPGFFERTLRDAASLLVRIVAWGLAALIVLSPFLALAALAALLERRRRQRSARALLERAA